MDSFKVWGSAILVLVITVFGLVKLSVRESDLNLDNGSGSDVVVDMGNVEDAHMRGAKDPKVVFTELSDFQCPNCSSILPIIDKLIDDYPDDFAIEYKNLPLNSIHPNADLAARAAEAAGLQDNFYGMHDKLFLNQAEWSGSSDAKDVFVKYAEELELDVDKFKVDIESDEVKGLVKEDLDFAEGLGIHATPTFFVDGVRIDLPQSYAEFEQYVIDGIAAATPVQINVGGDGSAVVTDVSDDDTEITEDGNIADDSDVEDVDDTDDLEKDNK